MRSQNGAAFDYRYQYLAGGVNTGSGARGLANQTLVLT
jgi:hypothetical protein